MSRAESPPRAEIFVRVKDKQREKIVPLFVGLNTRWIDLHRKIRTECPQYGCQPDVYYWDGEDYVRISSQEELDEAIRLGDGCLELYLESRVPEEVFCARPQNWMSGKWVPFFPDFKYSYFPPSSSGMCARAGSLEHIEGNSEETLPRGWNSTQSFSGSCQPSELPKVENPKNGSDIAHMQGIKMGAERGVALDQRVALENQTKPEDSNDADDRELQCRMLTDYIEKHFPVDEDEYAMQKHMMMPGASSGANVIAIEMPEMEHQGTETAEPAEIAETGEMSTKSGRDAETGFWVQQRNEARLTSREEEIMANYGVTLSRERHDELQRYFTELGERMDSKRNTSLRRPENRAYLQEQLMKLRECKNASKKSKDVRGSKKHCGRDDLSSEDSATGAVRNADSTKIKRAGRSSSTTLSSSSPLETMTEGSGDTSSLVKKHESRPSKSEGKKKKHPEEPLTSKVFFDYMSKFGMTMKKDLAKTVAKKTARTVLKSLPKQGEGSEASKPPAVSTSSGYVHEDIICDCCNREIVGTRYICGNCANYDLCEECENIQPSFHDRSHVFIKLRRPCLKAGTRHGVRVPLLKKVIYHPKENQRKVDPERIQVIRERTKGQESHVESQSSRNNNNETEDDQLEPFEQELVKEKELAQLKEHLKRAQDEADYLADTLSSAKADDAEVGEECEDLEGIEIEPGMEPVPTDYELKNVLAGALDLKQCFRPLESPNPDMPATPAEEIWPDVFERVPWDGGRTHKLPLRFEFLGVGFAGNGDMPSVKPEKEEPTKMLSGCVFWEEEDCEDCATGEFMVNEDGFIVFQPSTEASHDATPASHTEITDATIPSQAEVKLSSDARTDWQHQETDDVSSFSSFPEDSSSDEEFVVILPDCFNVSKPLHLEPTVDSPDSDRASLDEDPHFTAFTLGSDKEPEGPIQPAEISDGPENEADENDQHTLSADIPSSLSSVSESNAAGESKEEEEDFEEEEHVSLQEEREAEAQQIEDLAAASEEQLSETQSQSSQTTTEEPEDSSLNAEETDVKRLPEPEEEGAAAAGTAKGDSMDMMTKTLQVASSGLHQLFQTGKDIFKTLQSGDSYECRESTYDFKPSGYTLPESTWKPSTKKYVPPKSTFTLPKAAFPMPKSSYVAPQHPLKLGAGIYTGQYAGHVLRIREMGYFNTERTIALLKKYDGDIQKVVEELIEETDGDWAQQRHGNRS